MKRLKPEDLPEVLTDEILYTLAEMAEETAVSEDWIECSLKLTDEQKFLVYEKRSEVRKIKENERFESMTEEERQKEKEKWKQWYENVDPNKFYGNMGQPETPQEYNNRYGVWPPGYDNNGDKTEENQS